ncbi:MAG: sugar ABC transporter substrate-binding protein [Actinomycetes bacterium]
MTNWSRAGAVLLAGALALSGCGRDGGSGAQPESAGNLAEGKAKGTITVWAMGGEGENLPTLVKDFEKANPGANVEVTAVPWDAAHDKIATAIAAQKTPDVSLIGTTWMGEFAKTGGLDPVPTDLVDDSAFFPGAWDTNVVDGTAYGVPWYVETRLIYYRKDLAKKAGLTEPTTQAELKEFARGMEEKAGAEQGLYLQPEQIGAWQSFMPFAWQQGAELTQGERYTLDSPAMRKALDFYSSFHDEGLSATAVPAPGVIESGFVDGTVGAFVSGPWHIGILADQGGEGFVDKIGLLQMPTEKTGTSFVGGGNLAVFEDAKNREGAWKLVKWLSDPEVQQKWYDVQSDLPSVQSAWDSGALAEDPMLRAFGTQLEDAKSPPAVPTWDQVSAVIDRQIEAVVGGSATPAEAAKKMQSEATSIGTGS